MSTLSIRISEDLERQLDNEARVEHKPRSEIVREAIKEYIARRERERYMSEFIAEAKKAYADPDIRRDAQRIAEAFLPLDNEALDMAEGRRPGEPLPEEESKRWWK